MNKVYQIIDKATGEELVRLVADGVKRARWAFYAMKGFSHHGPVICRSVSMVANPKPLVEVLAHESKLGDRCACGLRMLQDDRWCQFASGSSPVFTISVKLRLRWCSRPECKTTTATLIED